MDKDSVSDGAPLSNQQKYQKVVRKAWSTGLTALAVGLFILVFREEAEAYVGFEFHWSMMTVFWFTFVMNLLALVLNLILISKNREIVRLEAGMSQAGSPAGKQAQDSGFKSDPEVKDMIDKMVEKSDRRS